ncbi:phenylalanine 4-monooxygenase [Auraticoccus monumenti]|uniref:Phenylalanine-4-hydroxylase n=1 Tax=Auraticoccus monumenti TaxID=675864 RepID=A0A1G6VSE9_9ACTN|nr:phenylalanine 4-monooxygenase [Auraticoccus monumenti]SDD56508.1 phenylalanine-4-hydroxylase [Auraticoccus monumenti]
MFEEGQLYSPVSRDEDGAVQVHLAENHPGFSDPDYRRRRNAIAEVALQHRPGDPVPTIEYSEDEHRVWQVVSAELEERHHEHASAEYLAAKERLGLPRDRVPQLAEVTARLQPLTGFRYVCAPGLVGLREFYGSLADREFHSTQYLRHPSRPLYTPEPDIIHEVLGHANQLASPRFAALTHAAGEAVRRLGTDEAVQLVADVFWFTLEFGVIREDGEPKAYGAGILSSSGELDEFARMEIRPLDLADMGTLNYDITAYQPVLFAAESLDHLDDVVGTFFSRVDDDSAAELHARGLAGQRAGV